MVGSSNSVRSLSTTVVEPRPSINLFCIVLDSLPFQSVSPGLTSSSEIPSTYPLPSQNEWTAANLILSSELFIACIRPIQLRSIHSSLENRRHDFGSFLEGLLSPTTRVLSRTPEARTWATDYISHGKTRDVQSIQWNEVLSVMFLQLSLDKTPRRK